MKNIIRTKAVELSAIPAIAYKYKLPEGGAGVKIMRMDGKGTASATINKRGGDLAPYGKVDPSLFPMEAFDEAMELLEGLPYSARGNIAIAPSSAGEKEPEAVAAQPAETMDMVDSDEYKAFVERYSDEQGRINYALMNKDLIQFAAKSKTVGEMVGAKSATEDMVVFIVKSRATFFTGKKESLTDDQVRALVDTLDEIAPRSAFKELKAHLNRQMARQ